MKDTRFRPDASLRGRIAPTELTPPRGYPLRGEVHDENAYALGGVAGHAGLFSTASDLSIFAQMLLNGGTFNGTRIIADSTVALFTKRAAGTRALGWDTCAGEFGCGKYMSANAYGHTGFTGTSLWIDPDRDMFVVLLTNRVHAAKARRPAKVISDVRADLADAAALAVTDMRGGPLDMPALIPRRPRGGLEQAGREGLACEGGQGEACRCRTRAGPGQEQGERAQVERDGEEAGGVAALATPTRVPTIRTPARAGVSRCGRGRGW